MSAPCPTGVSMQKSRGSPFRFWIHEIGASRCSLGRRVGFFFVPGAVESDSDGSAAGSRRCRSQSDQVGFCFDPAVSKRCASTGKDGCFPRKAVAHQAGDAVTRLAPSPSWWDPRARELAAGGRRIPVTGPGPRAVRLKGAGHVSRVEFDRRSTRVWRAECLSVGTPRSARRSPEHCSDRRRTDLAVVRAS